MMRGQDAQDLDFERLIRSVIGTHTRAIFREFAIRLRNNPVFSLPGAVEVVDEGMHPVFLKYYAKTDWNRVAGSQTLHVHLCADETVVVTIEPRTGKISLRDTGDLGAAGREPLFLAISEKVNESPTALLGALTRLRVNVCNFSPRFNACSRAFRRLSSWRNRKQTIWVCRRSSSAIFRPRVGIIPTLSFTAPEHSSSPISEHNKLGTTVRSLLYIQLMPFPTHYLVLVVTDTDFRYALISVGIVPESIYQSLVMEDIGWLDVERICVRGREARGQNAMRGAGFGSPGAESSKSVLEIVCNAVSADGLPDSGWRPRSCANSTFIAGNTFIILPSHARLIVFVQRPCGTHEG